MIRVVLFLIMVGALALGVAWLADRPGEVVITWQGLRIETSLMVLAAAVLVAVAVLIGCSGASFAPSCVRRAVLARRLRHRRGERAYEAISQRPDRGRLRRHRRRAKTYGRCQASRPANRWRCC